MPAPPPSAHEGAAPPRTELQELQYKAGQVTDDVSKRSFYRFLIIDYL